MTEQLRVMLDAARWRAAVTGQHFMTTGKGSRLVEWREKLVTNLEEAIALCEALEGKP